MTEPEILAAAELFLGRADSARELTDGHINRTFLIERAGELYVLQTLNGKVFPSPEAVMHNIAQVEKAFAGAEDCCIAIPGYMSCGERNYAEYGGNIWRMYPYVGGSKTADPYRTGLAFGEFLRIVSGRRLKLKEALPGFHDFGRYFAKMNAAAAAAPSRKPDSAVITRLGRLHETLGQVFGPGLPKRVIHGDAKGANIVLGEIPTVLDLDTVMSGSAALDFGDMVRSAAGKGEPDMTAVRGIAKGFAKGTRGMLSRAEKDSLYYGILWVTGELAMRYLTDYISGEGYFRQSTGECLARANQLLGQLRSFISAGEQITDIINEAFR